MLIVLYTSTTVFAQSILVRDVGSEHHNALSSLNITPSDIDASSSTSVFNKLKSSYPNVSSQIAEQTLYSATSYLSALVAGNSTNSLHLLDNSNQSLSDLSNSVATIPLSTDSALSQDMM